MHMGMRLVDKCVFNSSLTPAHSFSVATVMFSTTTLIAVQMVYVKHLLFVVPICFFIFFGFLDGKKSTSSPQR